MVVVVAIVLLWWMWWPYTKLSRNFSARPSYIKNFDCQVLLLWPTTIKMLAIAGQLCHYNIIESD